MASEPRTSELAEAGSTSVVLRALPRVATVAEAWYHPGAVGATAIGFASRIGLSQVSRWSLQLATPGSQTDPLVRPPIDYWPWATDLTEEPVATEPVMRGRGLPRASSRRLAARGPGAFAARLRPEFVDPSSLSITTGPRRGGTTAQQVDSRMLAFKRMLESTGRIPPSQGTVETPTSIGDVSTAARPAATEWPARPSNEPPDQRIGASRASSRSGDDAVSQGTDRRRPPGVEVAERSAARRRQTGTGWRERASAALLGTVSSTLNVPPTAPTPRAAPPSEAPLSSRSASEEASRQGGTAPPTRAELASPRHRPRPVTAPAPTAGAQQLPTGFADARPSAVPSDPSGTHGPVGDEGPHTPPAGIRSGAVVRRPDAAAGRATGRVEAAAALAEAQSRAVPPDAPATQASRSASLADAPAQARALPSTQTGSTPVTPQSAARAASPITARTLPPSGAVPSASSAPETKPAGSSPGTVRAAQPGTPPTSASAPASAPARESTMAAGDSAPVRPPTAVGLHEVSAAADAFTTVLRTSPAIAPRPLPDSLRSLTAAIVGHTAVSMRTDHVARRALAAAGKRAATVGTVIHLERTPHPRSDRALLAHELTHVAHPSAEPRFFADDRQSVEEQRADEIARLVQRSPMLVRPATHRIATDATQPPDVQPRHVATAPAGEPSSARAGVTRREPRRTAVRRLPATSGTAAAGTIDAAELAARLTGASPAPSSAPRQARGPERVPTRRATPIVAPAAVIRRSPAPSTAGQRRPETIATQVVSASGPSTQHQASADAVIRRNSRPPSVTRHDTSRVVRRVEGGAAASELAESGATRSFAPEAELRAAGIADLSSASGTVDFVDWILEQIEFRLLSDLQRRGGRFRGEF